MSRTGNAVRRWLDYCYGAGEAHQYQFYRCEGCGRLVVWKQIRTGGCGCGLSPRVRPAHLTIRDKLRVLFLPFTVGRLRWQSTRDT